MRDLGLDPLTGDLRVEQGELILISDLAECVAQDIQCALRFFLGEWFLDLRQGIPYFRVVFIKNPVIANIASLFSRAILKRPGVSALERFEIDYDKKNRQIQILFRAALVDGTIVDRTNEPFIIEVI